MASWHLWGTGEQEHATCCTSVDGWEREEQERRQWVGWKASSKPLASLQGDRRTGTKSEWWRFPAICKTPRPRLLLRFRDIPLSGLGNGPMRSAATGAGGLGSESFQCYRD